MAKTKGKFPNKQKKNRQGDDACFPCYCCRKFGNLRSSLG